MTQDIFDRLTDDLGRFLTEKVNKFWFGDATRNCQICKSVVASTDLVVAKACPEAEFEGPIYCPDCWTLILAKPYETDDLDYIMPGAVFSLREMGAIKGRHYPRVCSGGWDGKTHCEIIHCIEYYPHGVHSAWQFDPVKKNNCALHKTDGSCICSYVYSWDQNPEDIHL